MKYEIQVHFENQGQIVWNQIVQSPIDEYLQWVLASETFVALDQENNRTIAFSTKNVTAVIAAPKQVEDPIRRLYATGEREEQEDRKQEHSGDGKQWLSAEPSRCC